MPFVICKFKSDRHCLLLTLTALVIVASPVIAAARILNRPLIQQQALEPFSPGSHRSNPPTPASRPILSDKVTQSYSQQQFDLRDSNSADVAKKPQPKSSPPRAGTEVDPTPSPQTIPSPSPPQTTPSQPAANQVTVSSEEQARQKFLIEGDRLYQAGQKAKAEALYRQAKAPFPEQSEREPLPEPITDPTQLPPGGRVYWREAAAGLSLKLKTRIFVPLRLLVKEYPQFVPGHLQLADALFADKKPEQALAVMERVASLYPRQPDLQKGLIKQQTQAKRWLEASITARQFALLNPDHPDIPTFLQLSDEYQERFRSRLRTQITNNTIGSLITGALGIALTGNPFAGLSALQTSALLLRGETAVGEAVADRAKRQLPLIEDPEIQAYVDRIAQKLTTLAGRKFNYQFYVVNDNKLNAFALPGGKVFINGGAILKSKSEAELAGLIAHELSHAVLSHGFQIATESSEAGGLMGLIPFVGGLFTNLVVADYSRDMEQQADILGTRLLASAGYAADGLRNLMATLSQEDKPFVAPWFSSHPGSQTRIRYLETLITENGYNRYAYEGIAEHQRMQGLVRSHLKKAKETHNETNQGTKSKAAN
ncbi:MAG: M48 family metalloprotease [Acaryochloridaceae cyanobacterium CSU_3_4]|nr:M48 family metalloprotease [Acaryochloridaceae cyanobacterium CSU_3_4]